MNVKRLPLRRKLIYSAIVCLGFFGFLELGLRLIKVGQPPVLGHLRFGYDTGIPLYDSDGIEQEGVVYQDVPLFERHPELFWQPIANSPFTGPRGLRKPEPEWKVDTDEELTILILGDSCSFLGQTTYAARLGGLLQEAIPKTIHIYNASCPGYSSAQGVMRLKQFEELQPDLVIVYFGWNDHWRSLNGCTDRELIERNRFARRTQSVLGNFHFYWLIYGLVAPVPQAQQPNEDPNAPVRVPLQDYADNLKTLASCVQTWNGRVLFLTAPTAFDEKALPEWAEQFFGEFYQMSPSQVADIPKTHRHYNEQVRTVASVYAPTAVCDLETALGKSPALYRSDCIHLSEEGHGRVAELIAEQIAEN